VARMIRSEKKSFSLLIMRISIAATSISIAAMIIAMSFINGFQEVIADKVFGFWGHLRIQRFEPVKSSIAENSPFFRSDSVELLLGQHDGIASFNSFATQSVILRSGSELEGVLIKGIHEKSSMAELSQFLVKGSWPNLDSTAAVQELAISTVTASRLGIDLNQSIFCLLIQEDGSAPKIRKLRVSGLYKTGIDVFDQVYAIGSLSFLQRVNNWDKEQISGYEVYLQEPKEMDQLSASLFPGLPDGLTILTLREIAPEIFDWLGLQDTNRYILIIVMSIVALINLITCLIILVLERTSMIAILKALGMSDNSLQKVFLIYGAWINLIGIALGLVMGIGICLLQEWTGFIQLNEESYYVQTAPVSIHAFQVILICISSVVISFLFLLLPSFITRKIGVSKQLQFR
jgi:lipoprotein-releasing system permease protein